MCDKCPEGLKTLMHSGLEHEIHAGPLISAFGEPLPDETFRTGEAGPIGHNVTQDPNTWTDHGYNKDRLMEQKPVVEVFKPMGNYILVAQEAADETFDAGGQIYKPDITKGAPLWGKVIAVSDAVRPFDLRLQYSMGEFPTYIKVGDRILFEQYAGKAISLDGKKYLIMPITQVYGILAAEAKVAVV